MPARQRSRGSKACGIECQRHGHDQQDGDEDRYDGKGGARNTPVKDQQICPSAVTDLRGMVLYP